MLSAEERRRLVSGWETNRPTVCGSLEMRCGHPGVIIVAAARGVLLSAGGSSAPTQNASRSGRTRR